MKPVTRIFPLMICLLMPASVLANRGGIDVVVPVSPGMMVGTGGTGETVPACTRCCIYQNKYYSEGAVVKSEGVILQCRQNEKVVGTNNLRWEIVKQ